ncbi:MAG: hypothetical protein V1760_03040 [Candidatus Peregrinibacteria bacterium]
MNNIEQEIIKMIEKNEFLSQDLKKRYIVALFLMNDRAQAEYLRLWQAFDGRCKTMEKKPFILEADDMRAIFRTVDDVKKDLIRKIQSSANPTI